MGSALGTAADHFLSGDASGHHGDADTTLKLRLKGRPENDISIGIDFAADFVRGFIELEQASCHSRP